MAFSIFYCNMGKLLQKELKFQAWNNSYGVLPTHNWADIEKDHTIVSFFIKIFGDKIIHSLPLA